MITPSCTTRPAPPSSVAALGRSLADGAKPDALVVGDGLTGLACAHYLLKAGRVPLVLCLPEPGHEQLRFFEHAGARIDAFHLPVQPSDTALQGLLSDLDCGHRIQWRRVQHRSRFGPSVGAIDRWRSRLACELLRRTELAEQSLRRGRGRGAALARVAGSAALEELLLPSVRSVLGEVDAHVAPDSLHRALRSLHGPRTSRLGALSGGWYEWMLQLRRDLARRGAVFLTPDGDTRLELRKGSILLQGDHECEFSVGVSTLPWKDLAPLCSRTHEATAETKGRSERQDVVSVCIVAASGELGAYSQTLLDPGAAFPLCVQADHLLPPRSLGGRRVFYLTRRFAHGALREPDEVLAKQAVENLQRATSGFDPEAIEAVRVSTALAAERIPRLGDPRGRFTQRVDVEAPLFESSCLLRYPRPAGLETTVLMARDAASLMLRELDR